MLYYLHVNTEGSPRIYGRSKKVVLKTIKENISNNNKIPGSRNLSKLGNSSR